MEQTSGIDQYDNKPEPRKPTVAAVKKLLENNGFYVRMREMRRDMAYGSGKTYLPDLTPGQREEMLERGLGEDELVGAMTKVYEKHFSMSDVLAMIAFYKSEVGQKLVSIQDDLNSDAGQVFQFLMLRVLWRAMSEGQSKRMELLKMAGVLDEPGVSPLMSSVLSQLQTGATGMPPSVLSIDPELLLESEGVIPSPAPEDEPPRDDPGKLPDVDELPDGVSFDIFDDDIPGSTDAPPADAEDKETTEGDKT
jgi:hypothetical protein